ncbi:MAG: hypothetical protein M1819_001995 [Sarea resinae]|nr:MAG: hypothetical protein M1819_001995 [Sarea resinae]
MSTNHSSLEAASNERKARLAKLKSLKRKQPDSYDDTEESSTKASDGLLTSPAPVDVTTTYLSGRNYDAATRGPKLGFEDAPTEGQVTLEDQAREIAEQTAKEAEEEEKADRPIDLFKLQPKKPNWDLKRDLDKKLEVLNVRTDNAIAKLVRQRIETAQKASKANGIGSSEGENVGIEGTTLVEGIHMREREEAEDERRDEEDEEMS